MFFSRKQFTSRDSKKRGEDVFCSAVERNNLLGQALNEGRKRLEDREETTRMTGRSSGETQRVHSFGLIRIDCFRLYVTKCFLLS